MDARHASVVDLQVERVAATLHEQQIAPSITAGSWASRVASRRTRR